MTGFVAGKWAETTEVNPANLNSASVPVGGIIMYSGTIADLPTNWALCDGTGGTPDLRGRFVVGAEGAYAQGATGGAETVALTTAQLPSHAHGSGSLSTGSSGSHGHAVDVRRTATSGHTHTEQDGTPASSPDGSTGLSPNAYTTKSGGSHSHSVSGSTGSSGSGSAHENRPPYYALAYVQRVA